MERSAVIAIGGNALILDGQKGSIAEQFANATETASHIAALVADGWRVVVTHGNGPQVGFILLRSELIGESSGIPRLSLDMSVADSQGGIGHILGNALLNELGRRGLRDTVACILTHVVVDPGDPAFGEPTKPIGPSYSADEADAKRRDEGWAMVEDSGRGYRRIVPSPHPLRIVEAEQIKTLVSSGCVVIAAGGGGIPVVEEQHGYAGVEAVIDKDLASALLASSLGIPLLVLSTGVERVAIHFRQPDQRFLDRLSVTEARRYLAEGEFPKGSMGPKVEAAITFLERGGSEVLITSPANLEQAFAGASGTRIVADAAFASASPLASSSGS
jgi:carbamate kinase